MAISRVGTIQYGIRILKPLKMDEYDKQTLVLMPTGQLEADWVDYLNFTPEGAMSTNSEARRDLRA